MNATARFSPRRPKYGNRKVVVDGLTFASAKEARRYGELKILERAGEIDDLICQPRYPLNVNGLLVCTYIADFAYYHTAKSPDARLVGVKVTEDVKGVQTDVFVIKRKLMRAVYGIDVVLT